MEFLQYQKKYEVQNTGIFFENCEKISFVTKKAWIWIRVLSRIRKLQKGLNMDPDLYIKYTDPQHWL